MMKKGLFITFEGPDGSGKTTQIKLLRDFLKGEGFEVVITAEPGGTEVGQRIRNILLTRSNLDISPESETFLFLASRAELVSKVIKPALEEGKIVICDRFFDSTVVYQGIARGLGEKKILEINFLATGGLIPDITFLLMVKVSRGKKRIDSTRREKDRIEMEKDEFKEKIYRGYTDIAAGNEGRVKVINGDKSIEDIFQEIKKKVRLHLGDLK
ncbi:MAG: dTMP kinase [Actinomycetota bacterium]|nr:dTMP kinase [Actinomycetota bacterium]